MRLVGQAPERGASRGQAQAVDARLQAPGPEAAGPRPSGHVGTRAMDAQRPRAQEGAQLAA